MRHEGVPLLEQEGWLRHSEKDSLRSGADGVVRPARHRFRRTDHPVRAFSKEASRHFLDGASTPPVPGGEHPRLMAFAYPLKILNSPLTKEYPEPSRWPAQ